MFSSATGFNLSSNLARSHFRTKYVFRQYSGWLAEVCTLCVVFSSKNIKQGCQSTRNSSQQTKSSYWICRSGEFTERFHCILGTYLERNARTGAQFSHHHWILLHDSLIDLQKLLRVRLIQREHHHRGNLKAAFHDLRHNVTGDTCSQRFTPSIMNFPTIQTHHTNRQKLSVNRMIINNRTGRMTS